jgi:hypothetical protein
VPAPPEGWAAREPPAVPIATPPILVEGGQSEVDCPWHRMALPATPLLTLPPASCLRLCRPRLGFLTPPLPVLNPSTRAWQEADCVPTAECTAWARVGECRRNGAYMAFHCKDPLLARPY